MGLYRWFLANGEPRVRPRYLTNTNDGEIGALTAVPQMSLSVTPSVTWRSMQFCQPVFFFLGGGVWRYMGVSKNSGTPKSSIFNRDFHYKPSILGCHYFWKHPYSKKTSLVYVVVLWELKWSRNQCFLEVSRSPPVSVAWHMWWGAWNLWVVKRTLPDYILQKV